MDAIRYFRDRARAELRNARATGRTVMGLQKVQHHVAIAAGYRSWGELINADERDLQLAVAMNREPHLNRNGFGLGSIGRTFQERRDQAAAYRDDLRTRAVHVDEVRQWLVDNIAPRKTLNNDAFSYGLKHTAERAMGEYVSNGELIAAAIIAGYPYRRVRVSLNAVFGMSSRSITALRRGR